MIKYTAMVNKPEHPAKHGRQPRQSPAGLGTRISLWRRGQQRTVTGTGRCRMLLWRRTDVLQLVFARDWQRQVLECLLCTRDLIANSIWTVVLTRASSRVGLFCVWGAPAILFSVVSTSAIDCPERLVSKMTY